MDHPISNGFRRVKPKDMDLWTVENFEYTPGRGISGQISGEDWAIETDHRSQSKSLVIRKNEQKLGTIGLQPRFKANLKSFFKALTEKGYKISILSGDTRAEVEQLRKLIPATGQGQFLWGATAEAKVQALHADESDSMMVGDGINDIAAMKAASLSLCMPGALENNLNLADGVLTRGELSAVENVFRLSKKILLTERRLLGFTFTYNILCILAAATGWITPVVAAILMPISSITVLSLVTIGLRRL